MKLIEVSEEEVHFRFDRLIYLSIVLVAIFATIPAVYAAPSQSPAQVAATATVQSNVADSAGATNVSGAAAAKESNVLTDNPNELASELLELGGPTVGPDGAEILSVGQNLPSHWSMNIDNDAPRSSR